MSISTIKTKTILDHQPHQKHQKPPITYAQFLRIRYSEPIPTKPLYERSMVKSHSPKVSKTAIQYFPYHSSREIILKPESYICLKEEITTKTQTSEKIRTVIPHKDKPRRQDRLDTKLVRLGISYPNVDE